MSKAKSDNCILRHFADTFEILGITSDELTEARYEIKLDLPPIDSSLKFQLETDGFVFNEGEDILHHKDISFTAPHEYFLFKKRPVLVYIRDQYVSREDYAVGKINKFHVCFCKALDEAKNQRRFRDRYVVTTNTRGDFFVDIREKYSRIPIEEGVYKKLEICQDCLREINWKNFRAYCGDGAEWWRGGSFRKRQEIVRTFNIDEFLKGVRRDLFSGAEELDYYAAKKEYSLSWEFKNALKIQRGYKCERCGKVTVKSDLQIHHRNHNEGDNSISNLIVVCSKCHKQIHRAEGGYIGDSMK